MVAQTHTHTQRANTLISTSRPVLSKSVNMCMCMCMCIQMRLHKGACHQGNKSKSTQKVFATGQASVGCVLGSVLNLPLLHTTTPTTPRVQQQLEKVQLQKASVHSLRDRLDKGRRQKDLQNDKRSQYLNDFLILAICWSDLTRRLTVKIFNCGF